MRRESKSTTGSVVKDRRSKKWQFFWWADGRRHSKTLGHFSNQETGVGCSSKSSRVTPYTWPQPQPSSAPTVAALVERYRAERMPKRFSTRRSYESWLKCTT